MGWLTRSNFYHVSRSPVLILRASTAPQSFSRSHRILLRVALRASRLVTVQGTNNGKFEGLRDSATDQLLWKTLVTPSVISPFHSPVLQRGHLLLQLFHLRLQLFRLRLQHISVLLHFAGAGCAMLACWVLGLARCRRLPVDIFVYSSRGVHTSTDPLFVLPLTAHCFTEHSTFLDESQAKPDNCTSVLNTYCTVKRRSVGAVQCVHEAGNALIHLVFAGSVFVSFTDNERVPPYLWCFSAHLRSRYSALPSHFREPQLHFIVFPSQHWQPGEFLLLSVTAGFLVLCSSSSSPQDTSFPLRSAPSKSSTTNFPPSTLPSNSTSTAFCGNSKKQEGNRAEMNEISREYEGKD